MLSVVAKSITNAFPEQKIETDPETTVHGVKEALGKLLNKKGNVLQVCHKGKYVNGDCLLKSLAVDSDDEIKIEIASEKSDGQDPVAATVANHIGPAASGASLSPSAVSIQKVELAILELTLHSKRMADKVEATSWAKFQLQESEATGTVRKVIVFSSGTKLRIDIAETSEHDLSTKIMPQLGKKGVVERMSQKDVSRLLDIDRSHKDRKRKAVDGNGDIQQATSLQDRILNLRGTKGSEKKKRRAADRAQEYLLRAQRVAAYGLQEAQALKEEASSDDE